MPHQVEGQDELVCKSFETNYIEKEEDNHQGWQLWCGINIKGS